jgi:hypothetical protein
MAGTVIERSRLTTANSLSIKPRGIIFAVVKALGDNMTPASADIDAFGVSFLEGVQDCLSIIFHTWPYI